jgi:hypothetical protein
MSELIQLKILLVLEASGAGVGRHVIDLARELDCQGHTVHLIYSGHRMDGAFAGILIRLAASTLIESICGVRHIRMTWSLH